MASQTLSIPRSLSALFDIGVVSDLPDGQLLERFTTSHHEAAELAFHALVERHGPMVLRVCRRLLDDPNDAEDAFQATFLVLLRRAGAIHSRCSVAAWLHGVAMRVAARGRVESARRRRIERRGMRPETERNDDADRRDIEAIIDVELARLPEKYRAPVVLCYFEGLTHERAADHLGWPVCTLRARLSRARKLLRSRLTRRGITTPAALAAIGSLGDSAKAALPVALREAAFWAATAAVSGRPVAAVASARVVAWAAGASRSVAFYQLKMAAGVLLVLGTLAASLAWGFLGAPQKPQAERKTPAGIDEPVRREMLALGGTWSGIATVEFDRWRRAAAAQESQNDLVDRSRHDHRGRRRRVRRQDESLLPQSQRVSQGD